MKNSKNLKAEEVKYKIEEIVAVTSERGMKDVNSTKVREKLYEDLKNSTEYKYDENKSLQDNIYAAFSEYKLKELTEEYRTKINSWHDLDLALINTTMHLRFAASRLMIPNELTIKVKKNKTDTKSKTKENPYSKAKSYKSMLSGIIYE